MFVIKEKDAVYFAYPYYVKPQGSYSVDLESEDNSYCWNLNDGKGTIVAVRSNSDRFVDLLKYSDVFDCEFSLQGMYQIIENIRDLIRNTNFIYDEEKSGIVIFVARGNKCYLILKLSSASECGDFECYDENTSLIKGVYHYFDSEMDINERIKKIYSSVEKLSFEVHFPVVTLNTKDNKLKILNK